MRSFSFKHRLEKCVQSLFITPSVNRVTAQIAKVEPIATPIPYRPLGKDETPGEFLNLGSLRHKSVKRWVNTLDTAAVFYFSTIP